MRRRMNYSGLVLYIRCCILFSMAAAWDWIPEDRHPCNIERMTIDEVKEKFGPQGLPPLYEKPLILVGDASRNENFRRLTHPDHLLDNFPPDFSITLSSSNSLSEHRRTATLKKYLNETLTLQETLPNQRSNESWYLFGETYTDGMLQKKDYMIHMGLFSMFDWFQIGRNF